MGPLSAAVGAGILAVGLVAGLITGRVTGRRAERRRLDRPREPTCGCKHHLALHDPDSGRCGAKDLVAVNRWEQKRVSCPCRRYTGPEPIEHLWVPPVAAGPP